MNEHRELTEQDVERAYEYVLGTLHGDDLHSYEGHLKTSCEICNSQIQVFRDLAEGLALAVTPVAPQPRVRSELLKRIREDKPLPEGYTISRNAESPWESMGVPGVRKRVLAIEKGFQTILVQFDPGSAYPSHLHVGVEHCYVVSGDLIAGGIRLNSGDFQRAENQTMHEALRSETGCLLVITTTDPEEFSAR